MKKLLSFLLASMLLLSCALSAYADEGSGFLFELSVEGSDTKHAKTGDVITLAFHLEKLGSDEEYDIQAMQNEIRYDSRFFRLVEGSALLSDGIQTTDLGLRDEYREYYMNFLSMSGGETWPARRLVGSIQLEVIGTSGVSKITNQDCLVSVNKGQKQAVSCQDVTVIISTDCTVSFETNGGTEIAPQAVRYGEKVQRPEDPVRKGYHVEGWYTDIDLKNLWDFDKDTVSGNMTLYVKWAEGDPAGGFWWILVLFLLALLFLILFLLCRKTVEFRTDCSIRIPKQKVLKGRYVKRPNTPVCEGREFAGWYADEDRTILWDFDNDKVKNSMKLYAKWF